MARNKPSLVYGIGVNDADYMVEPRVNGRRVYCRIYQAWKKMLERCYSAKYQVTRPTYIGCYVAKEWLIFSNFKKWMELQIWRERQLDKDLLFNGNKVYSPSTCVFVDHVTNSFITRTSENFGVWPVGVCFLELSGKFQAKCCNPFTKNRELLGYYSCPNEAHAAWRKRKHELACQLADLQTDDRVAEALRTRYM